MFPSRRHVVDVSGAINTLFAIDGYCRRSRDDEHIGVDRMSVQTPLNVGLPRSFSDFVALAAELLFELRAVHSGDPPRRWHRWQRFRFDYRGPVRLTRTETGALVTASLCNNATA